MIKTRWVSFLLALCTASAWHLAQAQVSGTALLQFPGEINFLGDSAGPRYAVLFGNPKQSGFYVQRAKIPAGFKAPVHFHPEDPRTVTVISGTLYFAVGDTWDESKLRAYPAGTFYSESAKTPHYVWAKDGEVIIQIAAFGPTGTIVVEQAKK